MPRYRHQQKIPKIVPPIATKAHLSQESTKPFVRDNNQSSLPDNFTPYKSFLGLTQGNTIKIPLPKRSHTHIEPNLNILGIVEAGFPTHAEEDDAETITLDDYLIGNREASYILRVKGDSMIDAGIHQGDLVIVERGRQPHDGDIVIAQIDGDSTMKYYRKKAGKIYLEPANSNYPLLFPDGELLITAIVTAVVRKY